MTGDVVERLLEDTVEAQFHPRREATIRAVATEGAGDLLFAMIVEELLGPALERDFRTALILSGSDVSVFWSSVPAALFLGLAMLVVGTQVMASLRSSLAPKNPKEGSDASVKPGE